MISPLTQRSQSLLLISSTDGISSHEMLPSSLSYQKVQDLVVEGSKGYFGDTSRRTLG